MRSGEAVIAAATGRENLDDALSWIAEGYPLRGDDQAVLRALAELSASYERDRAAQAVTRRVSASDFDSAAFLFKLDQVAPASRFRAALDSLAGHSPDRTLRTVNARAALAAQRDDPFVIETLCAVAGMSYTDLSERVAKLPADPSAPWNPSQMSEAFAVIDSIVTGRVSSDLPGADAMRPLDLIDALAGGPRTQGWMRAEDQRKHGVAYEVLLAQRAAGGAWLAHRNTTSGMLNQPMAHRLAEALSTLGIGFLRASSVGGDTSPGALQAKADCDGQVGLVVLDKRGGAAYAVAFSSARDSGTASKNASRLRTMRRNPDLPMAVVVSGRGWSARNETADLALAFDGRLYADTGIDRLVADIAMTLGVNTSITTG